MKTSPFFKGLSWLLVLNILIKPIWIFAVDRQVQNAVGYQEYGRYFSILDLSIVLSFIADAGLNNTVNRQLALEGNDLVINLRQLVQVKSGLLLLYLVTVLFTLWCTHVSRWDIMVPVVLIQALTSLFVFFRNIITAHQLFYTDAWLSVIDKLLMITVCGPFIFAPLVFGKINLAIFLYAQLSCTVIALATAVITIHSKQLIPRTIKFASFRNVFFRVLPFALILLLMSAHSRLDGFLLERINRNGAYEAGVYASAFRLLEAGAMVGYLTASFLMPYIARNKNNLPVIAQTVINIRHALLFVGIAATTFTIILAPLIEQLLYHTRQSYNIVILQFCIASLPAYYLIYVYSSLLTAMGQFRAFIQILLVCLLVNVIINVVFIPVYGALACCIAAIVSQYACSFSIMITASKQNRVKLHLKSLFLYFLMAAAVLFFFLR